MLLTQLFRGRASAKARTHQHVRLRDRIAKLIVGVAALLVLAGFAAMGLIMLLVALMAIQVVAEQTFGVELNVKKLAKRFALVRQLTGMLSSRLAAQPSH